MTNKRRSYRVTPDRLVMGLLAIELLLLLSERFLWFPFNCHRGWTVLIAVATVSVTFLVLLLWFAVSLLFRWPFQFSIRSLLVLAVVLAVPCAWLTMEAKTAKRERETVDWIRTTGGYVCFDYELDAAGNLIRGSYGKPLPLPPEPIWLRRLLSDNFFLTVADVGMGSDKFLDTDLDRLGGLSRLQRLDLYNNTSITDAGLGRIRRFTGLRGLYLGGTNVTDAGLRHLESLPILEELALPYQITDAGLVHLERLTRLTKLSFFGGRVTDAGVTHLKCLKRLRSLSLWQTQVTDAGLENIEGLRQLQELFLVGTQITDAGLKHLRNLSDLRVLRVDDTKVADAGLEYLEGLTRLENLNLSRTKVTDAGLSHLKGLAQLRVLDVEGCTQVSDAGLVHLRGLTGLSSLSLGFTSVTDAGMEHLKGLTHLTLIGTGGTRVTDQGWATVKAAVPNCGFTRM